MSGSPGNEIIMTEPLPEQGRPGMRREDLEFMPAVVETLESPPSPYATVLLKCLIVFCCVALALMLIGRVDVVATGRGMVIPPGNVRYLQAEVQGRIVALRAADGESVKAGQVIIELDRRAAEAQIQAVEISLAAARIRRARQFALLAWLENWKTVPPDALTLPRDQAGGAGDQQEVLRQMARLIRERLKNESIPGRQLITIADERQQAEAEVDQANEKIAGLEQDLIRASAQRDAALIIAPAEGTLVGMVPLAVGMVVSPAQGLFQIVPRGSSLQVEAKFPTSDLGHVKTGDRCAVKLDAFPYTTWGMVETAVSYLGANSIEEKDGKSYFVVRCPLDDLPEPLTKAGVQLSSGMSATVEITTGRRSVFSYLLSPISQSLGRAFHER